MRTLSTSPGRGKRTFHVPGLFLCGCIGLTASYAHLISPYIFLIQVPGVLSLFSQIFGTLIFLGEILSMLLAFSEVRQKLQKRKGH